MLQHIAHLLLKQKEIAPCNVSYSFSNLCFVVSCIAVFICVEIVNARVRRRPRLLSDRLRLNDRYTI